MKPLKAILLAMSLTIPACALAQSGDASTRSSRQEQKYQRKTKRHQVKTVDSSDLNAILKDSSNAESGPILNDNGTINSSGSVDGNRSSTGRPGTDTTTSYTVKRKRTIIKTP
ncbi:hypothetical protein [Dyadobacter jiangsuensis]|uniref:Uncharacterized protein n=1 Tax=Dyadobacter jiangsuensis TaxID=1591085 RepID=A0A2P8G848_9BACT|nr:hypothetical protein [Dyadobacter jiangsuensis]PSL30146.1 hypothetical protein CLV60_10488 [Dyadobacter jiangsuensis]